MGNEGSDVATLPVPVGRGTETAKMELLVESVVAGAKRGALLLGEAGIGKTTLLRWSYDRGVRAGLLCARVRAPAAAGLPPRFPIGELLEDLVEACQARDFAVPDSARKVRDTLRGASSVEEYPADLPQIAQALEDIGDLSPIGIFVDDYQWLPAEGAKLLTDMLRAIETPLLLIAAARPVGQSDGAAVPLPEPSADLWIEHLPIEGLDQEAVSTLAAETLDAPVLPSLASLLYERTLGNPLFVVEALRQWRDNQALTKIGGCWTLPEGREQDMPRSLQDAVRARLSGLSKETEGIAQVLAVLGRPARFDEIEAITILESQQLIEALSELTDQQILAVDAGVDHRYRLAHPLYESSLIQILGPTRKAALHGVIYQALEDEERRRPVSALELAHHAVHALTPPSRLPDLLEAAAEESETAGSYLEAATWYEHLARISRDEPAVLAKHLEAQAVATSQFDPRKATDIFTTALGLADSPLDRTRLLTGRSYAHRITGSLDDALADLETASEIAPPEEVFGIKHAVAALLGAKGNIDEAEAKLRVLIKEATNENDEAKALGHLGQAMFSQGNLQKAKEIWTRVLQSSVQERYKSFIRCNLAWVLVLLGEWHDAEQLLRTEMKAASQMGDVWNLQSLLCSAGRLFAWKGDVADALDYATGAVQLGTRLDNSASVLDASDALVVTLLEMDSPDEAVKVANEADSYAIGVNESREHSFTYSIFGEAHLRAGNIRTAQQFRDEACKHLESAACWTVLVNRLEIEIAEATGDIPKALTLLERSSEMPIQLPFEAARLDETAARILMKAKQKEQALDRAEKALDQYFALNASRRSMRMEQWVGSHKSRPLGRPRSKLPNGLTEREMEVLGLVASGRTNKEIAQELVLSVATVKKHLEHIRTKTAAATRTELSSLFRDLQGS